MRKFFEPTEAPLWFRRVLTSIRESLGDVWDFPVRLWRVTTANLPTASTDNEGGILYDETTSRVTYSDGSSWTGLQPYDAAVASLAALSIVQGDLLYGSAADTLSRLAKDTNATRYLANTGTSNNPAWAQVDLTNGVTGDLPFANIAQIATSRVLGRTTAGTGDIEALTITGTGNVVFSASPTLTGTLDAAAASFSGAVLLGGTASDSATKVVVRGTSKGLRFGTETTFSRIDGVDNTGSGSYQPLQITGSVLNLGTSGTAVVAVDSSGLNLVSSKVLRVNSVQVVTARQTGWGAATGTATRTAIATYTAPTISSPPTQAEVQAIADALQAWSRRGKATTDDLTTHGLIGA